MNSKKSLALLGCDAPRSLVEKLSSLGFEVLSLPQDIRLQEPVRSHADMLLSVIENNVFCSEQYFNLNQRLFARIETYGYTVTPCHIEVMPKYPNDISLNLLYVKGHIFGKIDCLAKEIKEFANENNISLIPVNQGYTKCSTLLLGDKAIVCADDGIITEAEKIGLLCLKAENSPEAITLQGYGYGFIGGASGVFKNNVYFAGNVKYHPQCETITAFCNNCFSNNFVFEPEL